MADVVQANKGAVSSLADSDLVMCVASGGSYRPVSFANLAKLVRDTISIGGRNILLDSRNISSLPKTLDYAQTCKPVEGDFLAVTLYGTYSGAGNIRVFLVSSNGNDGIVDLTKVDDGVYFGYAKVKSDVANPRVLITTNKADSTTSYSIEKVIMTYGNALSAWSAAPEDSWCGGG